MMNNRLAQAIATGISVVPVFFLVFDLAIRLMQIGPEKDSFVQRGYPVDSAVTIGLLALVCIAWSVIPGTSVFGAIDAPILDSLAKRQLPMEQLSHAHVDRSDRDQAQVVLRV